MTLFRMVLSSKTLISMSCSSSSSSVSSTLLPTPLLPTFLPTHPCPFHSTAGRHHVPRMPARAWATADLPFPKILLPAHPGDSWAELQHLLFGGWYQKPPGHHQSPQEPFFRKPLLSAA